MKLSCPRRPLAFQFLLIAAGFVFSANLLFAVKTVRCKIADAFDFPVGKPDAKGYYRARGFWPNGHMGDDWNGVGGGNTDSGDPIYSIADGIVVQSRDVRQGWGNVAIIRHGYRDSSGRIRFIDSLYGHLKRIDVRLNEKVKRGQQVGTMGSNRGMYYAHLHFEIRHNLLVGMNRSKFKRDYTVYHNPTNFIRAKRKLPPETGTCTIPVDTFKAGSTVKPPVARVESYRPKVTSETGGQTRMVFVVPKAKVVSRPKPHRTLAMRSLSRGGNRTVEKPPPPSTKIKKPGPLKKFFLKMKEKREKRRKEKNR